MQEIAVTTWPTSISAMVTGSCVDLSTGAFMMATSSSSAPAGEAEGGGKGDEQCAGGVVPGGVWGECAGVDEWGLKGGRHVIDWASPEGKDISLSPIGNNATAVEKALRPSWKMALIDRLAL